MKKTYLIASLLIISSILFGQDKDGNPPKEIVKYYFVELIRNPDRIELPQAETDSIQRAHMTHIASMIENGTLMLAGPFEDGGGIFILDVPTLEEAEALNEADPAIKSGRLLTKIREWYTRKGAFTLEKNQSEKHEHTKN